MIVERALEPRFLSNTYLIADHEGGSAAFVDAGGPLAELHDAVARLEVTVTHVLLTHHHWDHVSELPELCERYPDAQVLIDDRELAALKAAVPELARHVTGSLGAPVAVGELSVRPLHTPGHTAGMQSLLVDGEVFTGDTLFKDSVGGVRAPGSTSFADIRHSIMDVLLALPPETVLRPGHTDPSTIGRELEHNPFARVWRGLDPEGDEPCTALGESARLVLWAPDYDGGHKAWVRWPDGRDDIVPGSKVQRLE